MDLLNRRGKTNLPLLLDGNSKSVPDIILSKDNESRSATIPFSPADVVFNYIRSRFRTGSTTSNVDMPSPGLSPITTQSSPAYLENGLILTDSILKLSPFDNVSWTFRFDDAEKRITSFSNISGGDNSVDENMKNNQLEDIIKSKSPTSCTNKDQSVPSDETSESAAEEVFINHKNSTVTFKK